MKVNLKRVLAVAAALFVWCGGVWAVGAGVQFQTSENLIISQEITEFNRLGAGISGNIKGSRFPFVFGSGINAEVVNSSFSLGFTSFFDYWLLDVQVKNNFNFYSGVGIGNNFTFSFDSEKSDLLNGRLFAGVNWLFLDNYIELYFQQNICPGVEFNITEKTNAFALSIPFEIGVRWHF